MKKKSRPNLTLSKETIVNLANGLENVRGGDPGDGPSDYVITCIRCGGTEA